MLCRSRLLPLPCRDLNTLKPENFLISLFFFNTTSCVRITKKKNYITNFQKKRRPKHNKRFNGTFTKDEKRKKKYSETAMRVFTRVFLEFPLVLFAKLFSYVCLHTYMHTRFILYYFFPTWPLCRRYGVLWSFTNTTRTTVEQLLQRVCLLTPVCTHTQTHWHIYTPRFLRLSRVTTAVRRSLGARMRRYVLNVQNLKKRTNAVNCTAATAWRIYILTYVKRHQRYTSI